jgi:hypothetical protein
VNISNGRIESNGQFSQKQHLDIIIFKKKVGFEGETTGAL